MKREILFRGKTQYGEWVEGSYLQTDDNTNNPMQHRPLNLRHQIWSYWSGDWNMGGWDPMDVLPETVSQFTGLTDKNGVKIFEGDIVKYYQPYSKRWEEHIVLWDTNWASFGMFEQGSAYCKESDWVKIQHIEVIGNIHDNKELIKE